MGVINEAYLLEYVQEHGIYRNTYRGEIFKKDFLDAIKRAKEESLPDRLLLLEDYREATFVDICPDDISNLAESVCKALVDFSSVRIAFLHNKPKNQVFSELFKIRANNKEGLYCEVFTTLEGALGWLGKK
jgi:hypothetical protein